MEEKSLLLFDPESTLLKDAKKKAKKRAAKERRQGKGGRGRKQKSSSDTVSSVAKLRDH